MKFLANENFPSASVWVLRKAGYDVASVGETYASISDQEVMQIAITEKRIILTFDRDYGELIFKQGYKPVAGVIYLRLFDYTPEEPAQYLINIFNQHLIFEFFFTVIDESSIRQRRIL